MAFSLRSSTAWIPVAVILQQAVSCMAADSSWQAVTGNWSDPASWVGGAVPVNDVATRVIFPAPSVAAPFSSTIDAGQPLWQINALLINNTSGGMIQVAPGSALQFVGPSPLVTYSGAVNPVTLGADLNLSSTLAVTAWFSGTVAPLAEVRLTGGLSGPGGLSITGANVALSGNNSFAGGVTLTCASSAAMTTLHLAQPGALGTGDLTLQTGTAPVLGVRVTLDAGAGSSSDLGHTVNINAGSGMRAFFAGAGTNHTFVLPSVISTGSPILYFSSADSGSGISWQIPSLTYSGSMEIDGSDPVTLGTINPPPASTLIIGNSGGVHLTTPSSYTGGTSIINSTVVNQTFIIGTSGNSSTVSILSAGTSKLFADVAGALGPGTITNASALYLNATNAAHNSISGTGTTFYNANGAAGGSLISNGVTFGPGVTSFSNGTASDTFSIAADQLLSGPNSVLALLDRGVGSGTTPNVTLATHAQIQSTDGALPAVQNLGTNADLVILFHSASPTPVAVGTGTPWGGVAASVGTVSAAGAIDLAGGTFGDGTQGSFNIVNPSGQSPAIVTIRLATTLNSSLSDYSGVSQFLVKQQLVLSTPNALGGGGGTTPASLEVPFSLTVNNSAAINGPVHFEGSSQLVVQVPGLTGTGVLTRDNARMLFQLNDRLALTGAQFGPSFIHAGDEISAGADDMLRLGEVDPGATYSFGANPYHLHDGLNLNGGTVSIGSNGFDMAPSPTATGSNVIAVGALGETMFAFSGVETIEVPMNVQGPLLLSSPPGPNSPVFSFTSTANQFAAPIVLNGGRLLMTAPNAMQNAVITNQTGPFSTTIIFRPPLSSQVTSFTNVFNLTGNATLTDKSVLLPAVTPAGGLALGAVTVTGGVLILDFSFQKLGVSIASLQTSGDLTLGNTLSPTTDIPAIQSVSQADATPRALTIARNTSIFLPGSVTTTGAMNIRGTLLLDGNVITSPAAVVLFQGGKLSGSGVIHRAVQSQDSLLSPGGSINMASDVPFIADGPGTLTVDSLALSSGTVLQFGFGAPDIIGGSANDLLAVNGDLTLDGSLQLPQGLPGPGRYTLLTYGGLLNDQGLTLPSITGLSLSLDFSNAGQVALQATAVPEPAALLLGIAGAGPLLLARRRRRS